MPSSKKQQKMSVEEYLQFEESSLERHEYVDGRIFGMAGATAAHNWISLNIAASLKAKFKGSGCRVYINDMKVSIEATNSFYYPDVIIDCGAVDKTNVFTSTPSIIFEVLSRSTASTDRREKLLSYQQIPALEAYIIVHQSRKCVEVYRREANGDWLIEEFGQGEELELKCCHLEAVRLSLEEIYEDTGMDSSPDLQVREDLELYNY